MNRSIKHRGPDGEGFVFINENEIHPVFSDDTPKYTSQSHLPFLPTTSIDDVANDASIAFGHRRLAIIDTSESGHQPMCSHDNQTWITYNGELYNYLELRDELKLLGYSFYTKSDTEVIINAYKAWGIDCVNNFNGMWAFCIYDVTKKKLFCARDRFGVKPFYYFNTKAAFGFSSEHKALIASGQLPFELNESALSALLVNNKIEHETESLFKHIYELEPAHFLIYKLGSHEVSTHCYYKLTTNLNFSSETTYLPKIIDTVNKKVDTAIQLRLRSDVSVGSCLSGGIDSSVIAGLMRKHSSNDLHFFSSIFKGTSIDESSYAQEVSEFVNGKWHTVEPTSDGLFKDIEKLNYYQDIPIWSTSTYAQYKVMELVSQNSIKVVLDGQGGDEIFAGYQHHYVALWNQMLQQGRGVKLYSEVNASKCFIQRPFLFYAKELLKSKIQYRPNYLKALHTQWATQEKERPSSYNNLNEQLAYDLTGGRLKSYLKCEDRCSMAFGIESRTPFADDIDLITYLFSIPGNYKIQKGVSKFLLRESCKSVLPERIYNRHNKLGFDAPWETWLKYGKKIIIDTVLASELRLVNESDFLQLMNNITRKNAPFIFKLYSICVWYNVFKSKTYL